MQFLSTITDPPVSAYAETPEMPVGVLVIGLLLFVSMYALSAWALGKVFAKAGVDSWKAWVPIYNLVAIFKLGGYSPLLILLMFVPLVNIVAVVFMILAVHRINEGFGLGVGMTVIYFFLPFVWSLMIGYSNVRWSGPQVTV